MRPLTQEDTRHFRIHWIGLSIVLVITALAYSNSLKAEFHFDDFNNILNNPTDHLDTLSLEGIRKVISQQRPIAHLSLALNYYYGDLKVGGYHAVNLLLHLVTAIILYQLILITLRLPIFKVQDDRSAYRVALISTLLWAVHPVQTQAVTYIVQRMTVMASLFSLLSLLFYVKARQEEQGRTLLWYGLSLMTLLLGLGSKQNAATMPVFMVLYEIFFISRFHSKVIERSLIFPLSLILIVLAMVGRFYLDWTSGFWGAVRTLFNTPYMDIQGFTSFTFIEQILTQSRVMLHYLSLIILPIPSRLNLDYDYPVSHSIWDPVSTFPAVLFWVGIIGYAFFRAKRQPLVSYCILWFYGNLLIESVLFKLDLVFEHRLYLPSMAIMVLVAVGLDHFWCRIAERVGPLGKRFLVGAGIGVLASLVVWTLQRNAIWGTDVTLWEDTLKKSPQKARPHTYLGFAYMKSGQLDQAVYQFEEILKANPDDFSAFINLAGVYAKQGKIEHAIEALQKAVQLDPSRYLGHYNLANLYFSAGQMDLALEEYQETLRLKPNFISAHLRLGVTLEQKGQMQEAIEVYKAALALDPLSEKLHFKLAQAYQGLGNYQAAAQSYRETIRLNPRHFDAHYHLAWIHQQESDIEKAIEEYEECLRLDSTKPEVHNNLGVLYASIGRLEMGIGKFQEALRLRPGYTEARYNLARAFQLTGQRQRAVQEYQRVVKGVSSKEGMNPYQEKAQGELATLLKQGLNEAAGNSR